MPGRTVLGGARRRHLYLFRRGAVDHLGADGEWVADPELVDLNAQGVSQAEAMAAMFAEVHVDQAVCPGPGNDLA